MQLCINFNKPVSTNGVRRHLPYQVNRLNQDQHHDFQNHPTEKYLSY